MITASTSLQPGERQNLAGDLLDLPTQNSPPRDLDRLDKLVNSWPARAGVRKTEPDDGTTLATAVGWQADKPDFLIELLPFHDHPHFQNAPEPLRQAALSCGWLAYNEKTVAIESKIVSPACMHLIDGEVAGFCVHRHREAVAQALIDESFHILLVLQANGVTRGRRQLNDLRIPSFELVEHMRRKQEQHPESWKKILIQLATAVVSEVLVSDYLRLLSTASGIQPLNRLTTEIHRRDESAHNGLFKSLGAVIYRGLSRSEKEFFVQALRQPSAWFASPELEVWRTMLRQIDFPGAEEMIRDCQAQQRGKDVHLDVSTLETLLADLGVENNMRSMAHP